MNESVLRKFFEDSSSIKELSKDLQGSIVSSSQGYDLKLSAPQSPMDNFPLSWRFTDNKYNLLPPKDFNRIHPLNKKDSKLLYDTVFKYVNNYEFNRNDIEEIESINIENESDQSKIMSWINERVTNDLFVIWDNETAVQTEKDIFVKYFDDFLYPSSDDAIIISKNTNRIMYFMHSNILYFGKIKYA
jgi:hypothetical protein